MPYCRTFCTYCSFYSERIAPCLDESRYGQYASSVLAETDRRAAEIMATVGVDTLYIGGGTPSLLPEDELAAIVGRLDGLIHKGRRGMWTEFTLEANPEDIRERGMSYLSFLRQIGVTRLSMGIQSFDDSLLRMMNRRHDAKGAVEAFSMLRRAGFNDISIDLIFGFQGLDGQVWSDTLHRALDLSPEHISAYQMTVEEGSALYDMAAKGLYIEPSDSECRSQYDILCAELRSAGYRHYEISNFARPGYEAVHNSAYWTLNPYVGLGPGAHSASAGQDGLIRFRSWNTPSSVGYKQEGEVLDEEDIRVEKIMLGLRTNTGIDPTLLPTGPRSRLIEEKALIYTASGRVRIPEDRFFVSDEIIGELI